MITTPSKVVVGSHPPQVWVKQENGSYIEGEAKSVVSYETLETIIDVAFSDGTAVVMIHQPDITRSLH